VTTLSPNISPREILEGFILGIVVGDILVWEKFQRLSILLCLHPHYAQEKNEKACFLASKLFKANGTIRIPHPFHLPLCVQQEMFGSEYLSWENNQS